MMKTRSAHKVGSVILAAVMSISMMPWITGQEEVRAAGFVKDQNNTQLGFGNISDPVRGTGSGGWKGSYVYYGAYNYSAVRYRVLDNDCTLYGGDTPTLLLDSDRILYEYNQSDDQFDWADSDIRNDLNTRFYQSSFSDIEKQSIIVSKRARVNNWDIWDGSWQDKNNAKLKYGKYNDFYTTALPGDRIFLLDISDIHNRQYGYFNTAESGSSRIKYPLNRSTAGWWFIRNDYDEKSVDGMGNSGHNYYEATVNHTGIIPYIAYSYTSGIAPALNLSETNVMFSTLVSGAQGQPGAEYKLTLKDKNLSVSVPSDSQVRLTDYTLTIPYKVNIGTGSSFTNLSAIIVKDGDQLVHYQMLEDTGYTSGTVDLTLSSSLLNNVRNDSSYRLYIFAELSRGIYQSDYCSNWYEITIPEDEGIGTLLQPKNLTLSVNDAGDKATLAWNEVKNADEYEIWVRKVKSKGISWWTKTTTTSALSATLTLDSDASETRYTVRAHATRNGSEYYSDYSEIIGTLFVDGVTAVLSDDGKSVEVSWNACQGAQEYVVYQQTMAHSRRNARILKEMVVTKDTVAHIDLEETGVDCYFYIRARKYANNDNVWGPYSDRALAEKAKRDVKLDFSSGSCNPNDAQKDAINFLLAKEFIKLGDTTDLGSGRMDISLDVDSNGTDDILIPNDASKAYTVLETSSVHGNKSFKCDQVERSIYSTITFVMPSATPTPTAAPKPSSNPTTKPTATPTAKPGQPTTKVTPTPDSAKPSVTPSADPKAKILDFVERIYIYVLDREPEEQGAAFWSDELWNFRRSGAEVAQGFIFSAEFENRNTTDKEFVTILYKTFFGRDPEESGMNFWLDQLKTGAMDRAAVANGFIFSQEWADTCAAYGIRSGGDIKPTGNIEPTALTYKFVERMYTTALGRGYDEGGRQYWAAELANFSITGEQVGASFFLSEEMENYKLDDKEYLKRLYLTFMDREPDADGEAYWLGVMAAGTPRSDVVFGFTRSPEFTEKCVEARILPY